MAPIDKQVVSDLLNNGAFRVLTGSKRLTLAFAGLYIATTTVAAKPSLVWEAEKSYYPRYYVPVESLHADVKHQLSSSESNGHADGEQARVKLGVVETLKGKGGGSEAVIERLSVGGKSTDWVRFKEGTLKGYVRFERDDLGASAIR